MRPGEGRTEVEGPIAMVAAGSAGPARFAADAEVIVTVDGNRVRAVRPRPGSVARTVGRLGWPIGALTMTSTDCK